MHVDHLKHHVLSMPVETEIPEGEPTLQPSTSHNPVGTTHLRDEDTNGIIEQQSQHRNQPSTATVREEGRTELRQVSSQISSHHRAFQWPLLPGCRNYLLCLTLVWAGEWRSCPAGILLGCTKLQNGSLTKSSKGGRQTVVYLVVN